MTQNKLGCIDKWARSYKCIKQSTIRKINKSITKTFKDIEFEIAISDRMTKCNILDLTLYLTKNTCMPYRKEYI